MNLLTWPERLIHRLAGKDEEEQTMNEPVNNTPADTLNASDVAAIGNTLTTAAATMTQAANTMTSGNDTSASDNPEKRVNAVILSGTQPTPTAPSPDVDFTVLRDVLAAIGYDIPQDRFESAVFLATSDAKTHG